jgi:hypothetical protein
MIHWIKHLPEQVKRLSLIVFILFVLFLGLRSLLVPKSFGEIGHYRKDALDEIVQQNFNYAGQETCLECHDDIGVVKQNGYHKNLTCEVCHSPSARHAEAPDEFIPKAPRGRDQCPLCHEYNSARPTGFPQIVSNSHNPMKPCISCHNPHNPVPPRTPADCSACHAEIARIKSLSHHAYISCSVCHTVPSGHLIQPRDFVPSKPATREFCGQCHDINARSERGIPRVDLSFHETRYLCWQCHYPHLPEAR